MKVGYARVSSTGQSLDIQIDDLNAAGVERIFAEKASATKMDGRPELEHLLAMLRAGDEVYATRLDRLARSVPDFFTIAATIEKSGATLHLIQQPIETASAAGRMFAGMLAVVAQFETEIRRDRQMEGIAKARACFKYEGHGRKPSYDRAVIWHKFNEVGMKPSKIAKQLGATEWTIRRAIKEHREKLEKEKQLETSTQV